MARVHERLNRHASPRLLSVAQLAERRTVDALKAAGFDDSALKAAGFAIVDSDGRLMPGGRRLTLLQAERTTETNYETAY